MNRTFKRGIISAIAAGIIVCSGLGPALAADGSGKAEDVFSDSSYSTLTPGSRPGSLLTMSTINGNPYGCGSYTERVHLSGGMSSVHAGIKNCSRAPSYQIVGAEIMKAGWFGLWHRSAFNSGEAYNRLARLDVNAKATCGNNSEQTYRGNGYHRVNIGGVNYIARTSSDMATRFGCDS